MEVLNNIDMIKLVKLGDVEPGDVIIDNDGGRYMKMRDPSVALRMHDAEVLLLSCISYPVRVTKDDR